MGAVIIPQFVADYVSTCKKFGENLSLVCIMVNMPEGVLNSQPTGYPT